MTPSNDEIRIASYSEFIAAGILFFIVAALLVAILLMAWFIGTIALPFLVMPLGLSLMIWGQLGGRAASVEFADCVTVRTLRRTVCYDSVAAGLA